MVKVSLGTKGVDFDWKEGGNPVKPPPKGLEPVGDSGWYHSPEVVEPTDCRFYPDSPFCGGNPIDPSFQVDAEVNVDPCGFTFTFSGSAIIKTPQFVTTYRKPECRGEYEQPYQKKPPKIPGEDYEPKQPSKPVGFSNADEVILVIIKSSAFYGVTWSSIHQDYGIATRTTQPSMDAVDRPAKVLAYYGNLTPQTGYCSAGYSSTTTAYANAIEAAKSGIPPGEGTTQNNGTIAIHPDQPSKPGTQYRTIGNDEGTSGGGLICRLYHGNFGEIWQQIENTSYKTVYLKDGYDPDTLTVYQNKSINMQEVHVAYCAYPDLTLPGRTPPPLPPPPERNCCMQCCFAPPSASHQNNNDDSCCKEVLAIVKRIEKNLGAYPGKVTIFDTNETSKGAQSKVIEFSTVSQAFTRAIERIEKISKIIGIDDLPLTVPKSIVDPVDQSIIDLAIGFFTGDTEKINNLFEYHVWFLKQFSAVTGKYMIEIEVPDTDVLQEGEQGVDDGNAQPSPKNKIVIPDISTGIREIIMMQIALYKTLGLNLDTSLLTLSQSALCMKEIGRVGAEVDEIVDFLDYPTDDAARDIPVFVTVPEKNLTNEEQNDLIKYLKPSQVKVKYNNWNGQQSLRELFIHFASRMGGRA